MLFPPKKNISPSPLALLSHSLSGLHQAQLTFSSQSQKSRSVASLKKTQPHLSTFKPQVLLKTTQFKPSLFNHKNHNNSYYSASSSYPKFFTNSYLSTNPCPIYTKPSRKTLQLIQPPNIGKYHSQTHYLLFLHNISYQSLTLQT